MLKFEEIPYRSADKFLEALRPHKWIEENDKWNVSWRFRGHGDAEWPLLPSAWRWQVGQEPRNETENIMKQTVERYRKSIDDLCAVWLRPYGSRGTNPNFIALVYIAYAEHILIEEFRDLMNNLGLPFGSYEKTGTNSHDFTKWYIDVMMDSEKGDASNYLVGTSMALAQHHGIPTRLLDWTMNPLIAAYFAAEAAIGSDVKNKKINNIAVLAVEKFEIANKRIGTVFIPRNENEYLHAQSGVFTVDSYAEKSFLDIGKFPALTQQIENRTHRVETKGKKLTLPYSQVGELLRLLWLEGITRAHLMPTIDNVAAALKVRWQILSRN